MSRKIPPVGPSLPASSEAPETRRDVFAVDTEQWRLNRTARRELKQSDTDLSSTVIDDLFTETGYQASPAPQEPSFDVATIEALFDEPSDKPILEYTRTHTTPVNKQASQEKPAKISRAFRFAKTIGKSLLAHDTELTIPDEVTSSPAASSATKRRWFRESLLTKLHDKMPSKRTFATVALGVLALSGSFIAIGARGTGSSETSATKSSAPTTTAPTVTTTEALVPTSPAYVLSAEATLPQETATPRVAAPETLDSTVITITAENNSLWKALKTHNPAASDTEISKDIERIATQYGLEDPNLVHIGNSFIL